MTATKFALVEIMGHQRRAGAITEVTFCGAPMLLIEHTSAVGPSGVDPLSVMYSPAAIFSVAECTFEAAVACNRWAWPDPAANQVPELEGPSLCPDCHQVSADCICADEFGADSVPTAPQVLASYGDGEPF